MSHSSPHISKTAKRRQIERSAEEESAVDHASIEEIAGALQALINSKAQSPSRKEIATVIARAPPLTG